MASPEEATEAKNESRDWLSWDLTPRQICDLELLVNGGFSPLTGFMGRADYDPVCERMRLENGTLWPIPVTLDVDAEFASGLRPGARVALRDGEGVMLAALKVEETWALDRERAATAVYGTADPAHPGVRHLLERKHPWAVGGSLLGIQAPTHYDFRALRLTPRQVRAEFERRGWRRVVAFQTRNPMHRAHYELTLGAIRQHAANLLVHPAVGMTKPGDVDHYTRVRCYQAVMDHYPAHTAMLALLPLSMRMAGPREAVWHAIIRKNFGCSHFIVGRDHAGPGADRTGKPYYGPYDAQNLLLEHQAEIGIEAVPFPAMVYREDLDQYVPETDTGGRVVNISGSELRRRLAEGSDIPRWFTFPEVAVELRKTHPPRAQQGFTVFFTGLSGAGKSTIANALLVKLLEMGGRPVTLLDGDIVRKNLSSELGFSREHRNLNIRRIGYVASEITKNGGIAICAPIAPYDGVRREIREAVAQGGGFVLVHVSTPIQVCEQRDRKGLYAKARAGIVKEFTGISDPYENPTDADVTIDTSQMSPEEAAQEVLLKLEREGFIGERRRGS